MPRPLLSLEGPFQYPIIILVIVIIKFDSSKVTDNSIKYMIKVQSWPFFGARNRLQLIMQADATSSNNANGILLFILTVFLFLLIMILLDCLGLVADYSVDSSNNVQWFKLNIQGVSLYPLFFFSFFSF